MMRRTKMTGFCFAVIFVMSMTLMSSSLWAQSCLNCHSASDFKGQLVHKPVKDGKCLTCHRPHASRHKALLVKEQVQLCYSCHQNIEKIASRSANVHEPVKAKNCGACHAPHASANKGLMKSPLQQQCKQCHEKSLKKYEVMHKPYADGRCGACHDPHGANEPGLTSKADPALCTGCHAQTPELKRRHLGKGFSQMRCLSCHQPHGGKSRGLIREVLHAPFAKGDCRICHDRPDDIAVCLKCHDNVKDSFYKPHSHLTGNGSGNPCTNCHSAHAADTKALLPAWQGQACLPCHADTFSRREQSLYKHPGWNNCTDCHRLHGANEPAMLKDTGDKVCGACHEQHAKFSHPIGEKALDPRNGVPLSCFSCHDSCVGTMFKYNLRGDADKGLCSGCHPGY